MDEEKESHFVMGKSRVSAMDYPAAVESFEKALEVNPRSAAAHFELACLYENRELDPAAAIYHYQQYLKFRPNAENAEIVNQRILGLKQELVRTVSLGPVTERQQREFERLIEENKRLSDEVEKWRAYATRLQALTNQIAASPPARQPQLIAAVTPSAGNSGSSNSAVSARLPTPKPASSKIHTVQRGETLALIARRYRISLGSLMAANPRIEPRHIRVGQTLVIP